MKDSNKKWKSIDPNAPPIKEIEPLKLIPGIDTMGSHTLKLSEDLPLLIANITVYPHDREEQEDDPKIYFTQRGLDLLISKLQEIKLRD